MSNDFSLFLGSLSPNYSNTDYNYTSTAGLTLLLSFVLGFLLGKFSPGIVTLIAVTLLWEIGVYTLCRSGLIAYRWNLNIRVLSCSLYLLGWLMGRWFHRCPNMLTSDRDLHHHIIRFLTNPRSLQ